MIEASLYTHIAVHCPPCPAHNRPRIHRVPMVRPEPAPDPVENKLKWGTPRPMTTDRRRAAYQRTSPRGRTVRQARQLRRMLIREDLRAAGALLWGPPK